MGRIPKVVGIAAERVKNPAAVALDRLGGLKGGTARMPLFRRSGKRKSPNERQSSAWRIVTS
jgi:hypothetical protein